MSYPRDFTAAREQSRHARVQRIAKGTCVLRTGFTSFLSCSQYLSVNLVAWNGGGIFMSGILQTTTTSPKYRLTLSLLSCLACGLLIGRGNGTSGQAPMCVPIGADMTAAVATRRRAFQYGLMHRQNCENPETRGVVTDTRSRHVRTHARITYTYNYRDAAHTHAAGVVRCR